MDRGNLSVNRKSSLIETITKGAWIGGSSRGCTAPTLIEKGKEWGTIETDYHITKGALHSWQLSRSYCNNLDIEIGRKAYIMGRADRAKS